MPPTAAPSSHGSSGSAKPAPSERLTLDPGVVIALPPTARESLPSWAGQLSVQVTCEIAHHLNSLALVAYRAERV